MRASGAATAETSTAASAAAEDAGEDEASAGQTARRLSPKQRKALMKEVPPLFMPLSECL